MTLVFDDLRTPFHEPEPMSEEDEVREWERRNGGVEFHRIETRHTKNRRVLDCHCVIPPRMEYVYSVQKVRGIEQLIQNTSCEFHSRYGEAAAR